MSSHTWNQAFSFEELRSFTVGHTGSIVNVPCPLCGPLCRSPHNRVRKVLRIWNEADDFITYRCARCGEKGGVRDHTAATKGPRQLQQPQNARPNKDDLRRLKIARYLYRRSLPSAGTLAETYLHVRKSWVNSPTIRFLPATGDYPPAMIVPFGIPSEPEHGQLVVTDVRAIQLTALKPDGSGKADLEVQKRTIGPCSGFPIPLVQVNDRLALTIAEGVEDALTNHLVSGRGAWATGGASNFPNIADKVPDYVESVTVITDGDVAGNTNSIELAKRLHRRNIEVRLLKTSAPEVTQ
jgi:hypothetical protein